MDDTKPKTWRAILTPHRSLSREGFLVLMTVIVGLNLTAGMFFYVIGAWPVVGFMGLDVALIWWAFRANFADARRAEHIEITAEELVLRRLAEDRPVLEQRFARHWVRVELEEDRERELVGPLYLRFGGKRTEIASFLGAQERLSFANALKAALINPHF
ncbi:MAG TPA: DUF2244 domain-containing protein [Aestuariivirga sp.]|nr:DUF2244 domain-containing protein [Aestuariivirga sp.]